MVLLRWWVVRMRGRWVMRLVGWWLMRVVGWWLMVLGWRRMRLGRRLSVVDCVWGRSWDGTRRLRGLALVSLGLGVSVPLRLRILH